MTPLKSFVVVARLAFDSGPSSFGLSSTPYCHTSFLLAPFSLYPIRKPLRVSTVAIHLISMPDVVLLTFLATSMCRLWLDWASPRLVSLPCGSFKAWSMAVLGKRSCRVGAASVCILVEVYQQLCCLNPSRISSPDSGDSTRDSTKD